MIIQSQKDVTPVVVDAYKNIEDPRLREIVASLVKHLHAFARDVHLTEEEFQLGTQIIAKMGQLSNKTHN
jgi:catechol 1,2-dioxygenase